MENLTLDFNNFGSRAALGTYEKCDSLTLTIVLDEKDYAGYKFKIVAKKSDGHIIEQDIKEQDINREERIIKTELNNQFTTKEGVVKLEINMIKDGKEDTTKEAFFIVRDTINGEVVESTSIIPTLEGVKAFIDEAVISLGDLEQAGEDIELINGEFKENEIKRKANELLRERSEKERVRLESIRTTEEADRIKAEAERKEAENNRKVAESNRKLAENTRKTNEAARVEAELNRQSLFEENEEIRNENENLRIEAEKERKLTFSNNNKFESERVEAEKLRAIAEDKRVTAEKARANAEEERIKAETRRENTYTDFNDSEVERKNNEANRVRAEAERVNAESGRNELFNTNEEKRNSTFIESERTRERAFNEAKSNRNEAFEESERVREEAFKVSEAARNEAEEGRVAAELLRVEAEKLRVAGEENRNNTFTQSEEERKGVFEEAENARKVAESKRVKAESSRVEVEKLRATAETGRVEAENLRVTAEEERVAAETKREEGFNAFEGRISANTKELKAARSATSGEEFNSLDERIDCEVDRLNKKIDVTMLQQEDKESHTIENSVDGMTTDMVVKGRTLQSILSVDRNLTTLETYVDYEVPLLTNGKTYTLFLINKDNSFGRISIGITDGKNWFNRFEDRQEEGPLNEGVYTQIINIPNATNMIKLRIRKEENPEAMGNIKLILVEGDLKSSPMLPYFEGIKSFGQQEDKISILSSGKNLWDGTFTIGSLDTITGVESNAGENRKRSNFISIEKLNTDKITITQYDAIDPIYVHVYDENKNIIGNVYTGNLNFYPINAKLSVTLPSNAKFLRFRTENNRDLKPTSIQIEEGTQSTSYQEYISNKKDILLNKLGFDEGLRGFDSTICDELNDIKNVAIKRIEKIVINDINISEIQDRPNAQNTNWFQTDYISNTTIKTGGLNINNKLISVTEGQAWADSNDFECLSITGTSSGARIKGRVNKGVTSEQLKERLKGLIVYYELAEPVETPLGESINVKTFGEITYVSFENSISGTSNFKVPVDTTATITRLNRENRALEEENKNLRQDFESTTLTLTDSDLELVKQNVDMDFRLMEVEFALDIPQAILSSNIKFKNKKGEVKSMARTPYEMMKIVILSGDYDREDYIHKVGKYYERGRMTKEEHDELMSLMTADEVISK
ncbi:hypothetical protein [Clostridium perfringens]|uniref:hypothetical protein n=1 Tax=Clostridium perfringens TaxID=1502 RepID=UPI0032DA55E7